MNENVPFPNPGSRLLSRLASVDGPDVAALQRVGDTVRRPTHANSDFVARLLTHLEQVGFRATHHYLGIDELLSARSAEDWDLSHLQTIGWATIEREHVERNAAAIVKALR